MGPECPPPRFGILDEGMKNTKRIQTSAQDPEALRPRKTRRIDRVNTPSSQGVVGVDEIDHQEDREVEEVGGLHRGGDGHQGSQHEEPYKADPQTVVCAHEIGHQEVREVAQVSDLGSSHAGHQEEDHEEDQLETHRVTDGIDTDDDIDLVTRNENGNVRDIETQREQQVPKSQQGTQSGATLAPGGKTELQEVGIKHSFRGIIQGKTMLVLQNGRFTKVKEGSSLGASQDRIMSNKVEGSRGQTTERKIRVSNGAEVTRKIRTGAKGSSGQLTQVIGLENSNTEEDTTRSGS